eukprot:2893363-Pleurochrysis_carterae.AAC.1
MGGVNGAESQGGMRSRRVTGVGQRSMLKWCRRRKGGGEELEGIGRGERRGRSGIGIGTALIAPQRSSHWIVGAPNRSSEVCSRACDLGGLLRVQDPTRRRCMRILAGQRDGCERAACGSDARGLRRLP